MVSHRSFRMKRLLIAALAFVVVWLALAPIGEPGRAQPAAPSAAAQGDLSELLPFPFVRVGHTVIYDPPHNRLVAFGGWNGRSFANDTWTLDLTPGSEGWTQILCDCVTPAPRGQHTAIYDAANGRMIVFGGHNRTHNLSDVWALDLTAGAETWTRLSPSGDPPLPRRWHSAVYDSANARMIVFGGAANGALQNDTWALTLTPGAETWTQLAPAGTPPSPRAQHTAVYDSVHNWMAVFGGMAAAGLQNDLWVLNLTTNTWVQASPGGTPPSPRRGHTAVYIPATDRMLLFGGLGSANFLNDLWAITLAPQQAAWAQLSPTGGPPAARAWHTATLDPAHGRMIVLGGRGMPTLAGEAQWALSLDPLKWTPFHPGPITHDSSIQQYYAVSASLAVEDAAAGTHVDLLAGSVSRFTVALSTTYANRSNATDLEVTLTIHDPDGNPATPLPVRIDRVGTRDGYKGAVVWRTFRDFGDGRYRIRGVDLKLSGAVFSKQVIFEGYVLPPTGQSVDVELSLSVSRTDWAPYMTRSDSAEVTVWRDPQVWVVTNRRKLFDDYDLLDVMDLLQAVYQEADTSGRSMAVLYADRYLPDLENWDNTHIDYTNETTANVMADQVARWLVNWTVGGTPPQFAYPTYLVIVGDDNIIPRYRKKDYDLWYGDPPKDCSEEVRPRCDHSGETLCHEMVSHDFFWTDNPYGDQEYGTSHQNWEDGDLEAAVGRIVGATARDLRRALGNAAMGPNAAEDRAIIASGSWDCMDWSHPDVVDALDVIRGRLGYDLNPSLVDQAPTKTQVIAEIEAGFAVAALAHHGEIYKWEAPGGPGDWVSICEPDWLVAWEVPQYDQANLMRANRPFFYFNACRVGISYSRDWDNPICTDGPGSWDDTMVNALVHQGASGVIASGGLTYYRVEQDILGDSEWLSNCFWDVAGVRPDRSEPLGWALMRAKGEHEVVNDFDRKAVQEFTYFGLPYMRLPGHGSRQANRAAFPQADTTSGAWSVPHRALPEATYTVAATVDASNYTITQVDGFDLIEAEGLAQRMEPGLPVLPQATLELVLPLSATLTSLTFTPSQQVALPNLDIPSPVLAIGLSAGATDSYAPTPDGLYPVTATLHTVPLDTYQLVRVKAIPVTYDATANLATLYRRMDLQLTYDTPQALAVSYFQPEDDQFVPGEPIRTLSRIVNAGDADATATARLQVLNAAGQGVGFQDSAPFQVPAGGSYDLALAWTGPLEAGPYSLRLLVFQDAQVVAGAGRPIAVTAGQITALTVPQGLRPRQEATFEVTFQNYAPSPTLAIAHLTLFDAEGGLVAFLEPQTAAIPAGSSTALSFTWTPPGPGTYTASATVTAGGQEYGPVSQGFSAGRSAYLPLVRRTH